MHNHLIGLNTEDSIGELNLADLLTSHVKQFCVSHV
jgi:hypothetical protein